MDHHNKNLKHYKKSMIDEYESHSNDTQQSPTNSDILNRSNDQIHFQQLQNESSSSSSSLTNKHHHHQHSSSSKSSSSSSSSTSQSGKKVYCICKTADTQRFMIGCDNCDDWFHGDCVGVSESFSKTIKSYFCPMCRFKMPSLKIKHKKKYSEAEIKQRYAKEISQQESKEREINKQFRQENETTKHHQKPTKGESKTQNQTTASSNRPATSSSRLEDEISETISSDNKIKLSSTNTYGKSRVSGEDIENFVSAIAKLGSDALTTTMASLQIPIQTLPSSTSSIKASSSSTSLQTTSSSTSKQTSKRQKDDDYLDENDMDNEEDEDYIVKPKVKKQRTTGGGGGGGGRRKKAVDILKEQQQPSQRHHRHHRHHSSRNNDISNNSDDADPTIKSPKQCLGPGCTHPARYSSKYCSDECGLKLAKNRIIDFLKENPNESNRRCCADELNEKQLAKINSEIENSKNKLNELDQRHEKLDEIIERAKYEKINEKIEMDKDAEETEIYCVTCGHTFNEKNALKHMERCFNKLESQAFFGSLYKSPEGQTLFCDYYNAQTKMYCKRLKVMCPEHEKEKKINENEVCGCPLYKKKNMLDDSNEICLQSKRNCQLHFKWEKMRRAQIDLEKLRLWMKLDELYEQKRMVEMSLNNRNGILSCMLHKTIACNA